MAILYGARVTCEHGACEHGAEPTLRLRPTEQGGAHEPESGTTVGGGIIAVETDSW